MVFDRVRVRIVFVEEFVERIIDSEIVLMQSTVRGLMTGIRIVLRQLRNVRLVDGDRGPRSVVGVDLIDMHRGSRNQRIWHHMREGICSAT